MKLAISGNAILKIKQKNETKRITVQIYMHTGTSIFLAMQDTKF